VSESATILAVDDRAENIRLLEAVLVPQGYVVVGATSGEEALAKAKARTPDLVLLDIVMPGMDGYEVCRRLREDPATSFVPIVMITASEGHEKAKALDAGADDFVPKPFDQTELIGRVRSLLRVKQYHDTIERQKAQLARFLSPQIAALVSSGEGEKLLEAHRREISVVVLDMRGFTAFSETGEPEEVLGVIREFQAAMGRVILEHEGTLEHFAGDGMMVYFNDPVPRPDHPAKAVRMAVAIRARFEELAAGWRRRGYELGLGIGVGVGYATLGRIGFEGRYDYGAVGAVVNLAHRICGEAKAGQILINQRVHAAVEDLVDAERIGDLTLKGFSRPIGAYNVLSLREAVSA